jgi:multiple sugar transport system substrate-binding protein
MRKFAALLLFLAVLATATAQTQVRWFVGLGAGTDEPLFEAQQAIVAEFNASQSDVRLVLEIVDNTQAYDVLATQIAAGNSPDIVGPMGIRGLAAFPGVWLDLDPLVQSTNYDLSDFDPAMVEFYQRDEGRLGIPFAVFPSYITYNKALFDEAGLPYPPATYGEPYVDENGETHTWDVATMSELAKKLTVDANGADATMDDFDPNNVVQWGFGTMWRDIRGDIALFGAGNFVDEDGNATMPDHWRTGLKWYQDAMWTDHFYPNGPYGNSALLAEGNWFDSGNLAMAQTQLWYAGCCMFTVAGNDAVDFAAMPSYEGQVTATVNADTFSIPRASRNHEAAFEALSFLLSPEVAGRLNAIYGGMPARLSLQGAYFNEFGERNFPALDLNWDVVAAGLSYPDVPNHEDGLPGFREAEDRYNAFTQRLENEPDFDLDSEIELLLAELQLIFDAANARN